MIPFTAILADLMFCMRPGHQVCAAVLNTTTNIYVVEGLEQDCLCIPPGATSTDRKNLSAPVNNAVFAGKGY